MRLERGLCVRVNIAWRLDLRQGAPRAYQQGGFPLGQFAQHFSVRGVKVESSLAFGIDPEQCSRMTAIVRQAHGRNSIGADFDRDSEFVGSVIEPNARSPLVIDNDLGAGMVIAVASSTTNSDAVTVRRRAALSAVFCFCATAGVAATVRERQSALLRAPPTMPPAKTSAPYSQSVFFIDPI